ncbi:MAG: class I SAM-dependent methyltransferase [Actinobacteria bacterium]|nr:class I SAM-dependent methyltransferase [Actinomycetota bacterium]
MAEELLERWLGDVLSTPGMTGLRDPAEARRILLEDALRAGPLIERTPGAIVDVGSGGGSPGIPLAVAFPYRPFTLLEAERRKCDFLCGIAAELPNVEVVWGRAEEQPTDVFGVALAKALAKPPVAAELCLPLIRAGGIAIVWTGETAEPERVAVVAEHLGARLDDDLDGLLVLRKIGPTPAGFPRRPGVAKKRPLA